MFFVNVQEAFGIHPNEALEMSFALLQAMLQEYYFMWKERNKEDTEDENGEFEWVELPDWNDPTKTIRMKKYADVGSFVK